LGAKRAERLRHSGREDDNSGGGMRLGFCRFGHLSAIFVFRQTQPFLSVRIHLYLQPFTLSARATSQEMSKIDFRQTLQCA
jgi:hypothetical protein